VEIEVNNSYEQSDPLTTEPQLSSNSTNGRTALEVINLSKWFGGLGAVIKLSFTVGENEIFGVMGPNGAGKTTMLNLVSGLLKPDEGNINIRGQDFAGKPAFVIAKERVARTYQNIRLVDDLSILETIASGFFLHRTSNIIEAVLATRRERKERQEVVDHARDLIHKVGLKIDPETIATTLSYGDQRRVEIARALASKPRLLLLDEPTAGMNAAETAELGNLFLHLRSEGITLVIIEHNMRMILNFCEKAIVMNFGELLAQGHPRECVEKAEVREAYFGKAADAERIESIIGIRRD
jgi:branched-chain amino acid transport system ATP-binding protein